MAPVGLGWVFFIDAVTLQATGVSLAGGYSGALMPKKNLKGEWTKDTCPRGKNWQLPLLNMEEVVCLVWTSGI